MHVSITHYDDIIAQGTGEIITMYMVCVQYSSRSSYMLGKRYSDFSTLHAFVKDYLPSDYKFPNKSLFHNNAQFTKERRIRGFDELLKFCSKHLPLNPDFQAFLEIKDHISPIERDVITEQMKTQALENTSGDSSHHSSHSSGSNDSSGGSGGGGVPRRAVIKSVSLKSKVDFQNETVEEITVRTRLSQLSNFLLNQTINPNENLSSYEIAIKEKEDNFRYKFHQSAPTLLFSALKTSLIVYFIFILLSIIDVSRHLTITNWTRTFYTFSSITMILLFSDIRKIRKNLPKNQLPSTSNNKKKEKTIKWNNNLKREGGVNDEVGAGNSSPVQSSIVKNGLSLRKKKVTIVDS
jgi:hypothetical protein